MPTRRMVLGLGAAVLAWPAAAQSNLLERGKGLLDSIGRGGSGGGGSGLSQVEVGNGLKEALRVGSQTVVARLGAVDGFNLDPVAHIELPSWLETVRQALSRVGQSAMLDDLTLRLNRGAETATAQVKPLFWDAIEQMTLQDVMDIYNGPDDAATQYFRRTMDQPLKGRMRPVIDDSLADVGAVKSYERTVAQYKQIPLMPDVKGDLTDHVLGRSMDGIFHYIGKEEAAIRHEPAKQVTPLLKKVFG